MIEQELRRTIAARMPRGVSFYTEYLDGVRFPAAAPRVGELLLAKYADTRFDLAVAIGSRALAFLLERRKTLIAGAPLLFTGIRENAARAGAIPGDVTGIVSGFDLVATVELALLLQPWARNLVIVSGAADIDKDWDARARATLGAFDSRLKVAHLSGLPLARLLDSVRGLDRDSIVLFLSYAEDGDGRELASLDVVDALSGASGAPVYGVYSTYLGRGIVGGYLDTFEEIGRATGELALGVLNGQARTERATVLRDTASFHVDWRQMRRWNLAESALPPNTVVANRKRSFWTRYQGVISTVLAVLVLQSALIVGLLIQRRRRRRAERSLAESEERMTLAATSANMGLWQWDIPSNSFWSTEHCRYLLDIDKNRVNGLGTLISCFDEADQRSLRDDIAKAIEATHALDAEYRVQSTEAARWIRLKGRAILDKHGSPVRLMGVAIDVSDRKRAEINVLEQRQQLAHLTRVVSLGNLSGALAHELNQPLTAIVGNAQAGLRLLQQERLVATEAADILGEIASEGTRAGHVISRLRTLLRNNQSQSEALNLNDIISEVLRLLHGEIIGRDIRMVTQLAGDLPEIRGDRVELEQVVLNLIVNACEAMAGNGRGKRVLRIVTSAAEEQQVEMLIADRGPGIKSEIAAHLFDPFITTKENGLGLGLSITRTIVEAHGGRISADNTARGAVFRVVIPASGGDETWIPQVKPSISSTTMLLSSRH